MIPITNNNTIVPKNIITPYYDNYSSLASSMLSI